MQAPKKKGAEKKGGGGGAAAGGGGKKGKGGGGGKGPAVVDALPPEGMSKEQVTGEGNGDSSLAAASIVPWCLFQGAGLTPAGVKNSKGIGGISPSCSPPNPRYDLAKTL